MSELATRFDAAKMTHERALELAKNQPEKAADMLMALLRRDTDAFPDTCFVKRGKDGDLRKFMASVRLSESDGTLVKMGSKKVGNDWVAQYGLSMAGYRKINGVVNLQVMRPSKVIVDGKEQMNPYIQVDPETRMPHIVYARCLAVGLTNLGSLVATDVMVRLDLAIYLLENIQAKMGRAKTEEARRDVAEYGVKDQPPEGGTYTFFPIHGAMGLWVNIRSREIQDILSDHTTRLKFIERLAQSFAERNAVKAHPAMPATVDAKNGVASVRAIGWTTDFTRDDLARMQELIEVDRFHEFESEGRLVEIRTPAVVEKLDEAARADLEAEISEAQRHESGESESHVAEADAALLDSAREAYGRLCDLEGKAATRARMIQAGFANLEEATEEELRAFIQSAEDAENGR